MNTPEEARIWELEHALENVLGMFELRGDIYYIDDYKLDETSSEAIDSAYQALYLESGEADE